MDWDTTLMLSTFYVFPKHNVQYRHTPSTMARATAPAPAISSIASNPWPNNDIPYSCLGERLLHLIRLLSEPRIDDNLIVPFFKAESHCHSCLAGPHSWSLGRYKHRLFTTPCLAEHSLVSAQLICCGKALRLRDKQRN